MRRLVYYVAVTLDGFIAAPDGDYSIFDADGDHMQTQFRDFPDALPGAALTALGLHADGSRFDTVVMGWNTYAVGLPQGITDPYPHLDTHVFSRAHIGEGDAAISVTDAQPIEVVRDLKQRAGSDVWLCGGGQLAAALWPEIDSLILKTHPIVLGEGIPLFGRPAHPVQAAPARFAVASHTPHRSGVAITEYRRRP